MGPHLVKHGDGVKDIAMAVDNLDNIVWVNIYLCHFVDNISTIVNLSVLLIY